MERTEKFRQAVDSMLTRREVASILKVNLCTLSDWDKKRLLCPTRIGRRVYYKSQDLEKFLDM